MKTALDQRTAGRILFWFLVIGLCSVTLYFAFSRRSILGYDGEAYIFTAEKAAEDHFGFLKRDLRRPPFFPALLNIGFFLFGKSLISLHVFPLLFMLISPFLFYFIILRVCGSRWWALFGAMVFLFFPNSRTQMCQPLTEPAGIFLILVSMLLLEMIAGDKKYLLFLLLACLLSLSMLKFELISALVIFALCGLSRSVKTERFKTRKISCVAGFTIICLLVLFLIFHIMGGSRYLPDLLIWYFRMLEFNLGKSVDRIYMYGGFWSLFQKNARAFFSYPVPFFILIVLGAVHSFRLRRKYLSWYLLFPVILYLAAYFSGFGQKMIRLISPSIPVFALFMVMGIHFIFRLVKDHTRPPLQTGLFILLGALAALLIFSSYHQADLRWRADFLYKRDVASLTALWTHNIEIPSYRERLELKKRGILFDEELLNFINGFFREPYYLAKWRYRWADSQSVKISAKGQEWRGFVHRIQKDGQPVEASGIAFPGADRDGKGVEIVFRLPFDRPIHTLHYIDRYNAPNKGDHILFSISPDGRHWRPVYQVSGEAGPVTLGAHFRQGFSGRSEIFLKYRFQSVRADGAAAGLQGASLMEVQVAADFSACKPLYGDDWAVDRYEGQ